MFILMFCFPQIVQLVTGKQLLSEMLQEILDLQLITSIVMIVKDTIIYCWYLWFSYYVKK